MVGSGLFISSDDFRGMAPELQAQLQDWLAGRGRQASATSVPPVEVPESAPGGEEDGSDLSLAQAKRLLEGCGDKTKAVLRIVFSKDKRSFVRGEIAREMGGTLSDLGGVWAGLTKRTRTVLGDKNAGLFAWDWDDAKGDWIGESSETTYQSMRKALGIA